MNMKRMRGVVDPISLGFLLSAFLATATLSATSATSVDHKVNQAQPKQAPVAKVQVKESSQDVLDLLASN